MNWVVKSTAPKIVKTVVCKYQCPSCGHIQPLDFLDVVGATTIGSLNGNCLYSWMFGKNK